MTSRKAWMVLVLIVCGLSFTWRGAQAQNAPELLHLGTVSWWKGLGTIWLVAETQSIQYLKADLYVARDIPFGPVRVGNLGMLLIDPGNLVYCRLGLTLFPVSGLPWKTMCIFEYPVTYYELIGTKFRVQVVGYDATQPGRYVLSRNAAVFTVTL